MVTLPVRGRRLLGSEQAADLVALSIFIVVPAVVFGVPAATGHPLLYGDNLIQNFPLRVLAGHQIAQGHLPLWNPFVWSGSPLLAGFNAGALYPGTLAFAVMPATAAWALNQIAVPLIASCGLYAFCRSSKLRPLASFLAALSFSLAGAMSAQVVHIGLIAGMSWLPWMMLGIQRIGRSVEEGEERPPWRWVTLVSFAGGMLFLAGEPRAMANALVVVLLYGGWILVRSPQRWALAGYLVVAAIWALAIGAVQLVPGIQFLHSSQRTARATYASFGAGSLPLSWTLLLFVPDLLGGSGSFGQPTFLGRYQLTEVTAYVGLLPLVACAALLVQSRLPGSRADRQRRHWGVWYWVAAAGLLLAFGNNTVLGRVFWHLPLYGGQRLQSRNLMIVDLALCVILAYWLDDIFDPPPPPEFLSTVEVDEAASPGEQRAAIRERRAEAQRHRENRARVRWIDSYTAKGLSAAPAILALLVCLVALYWGPGLARALGHVDAAAVNRRYRELIPSIALFLGVSLLAGFVAAFHRSLPGSLRKAMVGSFVLLDVAAFTGSTVVQLSSSALAGAKATVVAAVGAAPAVPSTGAGAHPASREDARFAIFDPDLANPFGLTHLGQPDLNILRGIDSVQGYSSIAPGTYADATGTHGQDLVSPQALQEGRFDQLNLQGLYTLSRYLSADLERGAKLSPQEWSIAVGGSRGWFFGDTRSITAMEFTNLVPAKIPIGTLAGVSVGLIRPDGSVDWSENWVDEQPGTAFEAVATPIEAIGVEMSNLSPVYPAVVTGLVLTTSAGVQIGLQGPLAGFIDPARWHYAGPAFGYQLFQRATGAQAAFLVGSPAGSWNLVSGSLDANATIAISTPTPATFVRSLGYTDGWHAHLEPMPRAPLPRAGLPRVAVRSDDLIQSVQLPAGSYLLQLTYKPSAVTVGVILSLAGGALLLIAVALSWSFAAGRSTPRRRAYPC